MRRTLFYCLAGAFLIVAACDEPLPEPIDDAGFQLEEDQISLPGEGGQYTLSVKSDREWTVSVKDDWCSVSPASGSGSTTVTITADANPDKQNGRSTKVMFTYNGIVVSATVNQEKNPAAPVFSLSATEVNVGNGEESFTLTVVSEAAEYEVTLVDAWIHEQARTGDRLSGETITFWVNANEWDKVRSGVISICTKDGSCIPVMVNQAGIDRLYHRQHIGFRFTATWCGYCPYMDEAFHKAADQNPDFLYMTLHASKGYPLYFMDSEILAKNYKVDGFPTGVLNGWKPIDNTLDTDYTAGVVLDGMAGFDQAFPCVVGIGVRSVIDGNILKVEADIEASVTDDYKVAAFIVESDIVQKQAYYPTTGGSTYLNDFVHDNVARATLSADVMGDPIPLEAGETVSYMWNAGIDTSWNPDNLGVVVYVYRPYGDTYADYKGKRSYPNFWIVNARNVAVGEKVEIE